MRETFVAIITSNLPMILPLVARCFRPIFGSLRTMSTSANKPSKSSRSKDGKARAFVVEDKNPRRGMGPRSVNPIPNFSANGSEEDVQARPESDGAKTVSDTDVQAGHGGMKNGVIIKQTSLEIIEMRRTEESAAEDAGDYYLVRQQQEAELGTRKANPGRWRRSTATVGVGRAV